MKSKSKTAPHSSAAPQVDRRSRIYRNFYAVSVASRERAEAMSLSYVILLMNFPISAFLTTDEFHVIASCFIE